MCESAQPLWVYPVDRPWGILFCRHLLYAALDEFVLLCVFAAARARAG
jgi:hypothetical protein